MSSIIVNIEENYYKLTGNIDIIASKRRSKSNFESIGALFDLDNKIILIPFSTEEQPNQYENSENQYKAILRLFDKFNIEYSKTEDTNKFVEDIDRENRNFSAFSSKAKNIRNNYHENDDFKIFTDTVEKELTRELYPLQLLSAYHMSFSQNACNFSVPGAGKTSIVYGAYSYLKILNKDNPKFVDRLLIIGPLSSFAPWKNEYKECFGHSTSIKELVGISQIDRQNHFFSNEYTEITLISYQSAALDVENIISFLKMHKVMVVLDEAHKIKNVEGGKWAEALLTLAKYVSARVILTGTPAPNGYQDLYNLYQFIWPHKNVIGFPVHYLQELSYNKTPQAKENVKILIDNISPFFIRIRKRDLDLPNPIINKPIFVQMGKIQQVIYNHIEKKYIDYLEQEKNVSSFTQKLKKAKLIRLMQCLTNPKLLFKPLDEYLQEAGLSNDLGIDDRNIIKLLHDYSFKLEIPPKFIEIAKLIKRIITNNGADGKVIIWAIFIGNMFDLQAYLLSQGISSELLYGGIPNENQETPEEIRTREKIINEFHNEKCPYKVIIANPFAVGESISLHKACHNAIYLEKNFNAAMYMQSKDRVHRYGLKDNEIINYYYLLSKNSIDKDIHDRVLKKEERMLEIIENEEIPLLSMNMDSSNEDEDDIKAIIKSYHDRKNI